MQAALCKLQSAAKLPSYLVKSVYCADVLVARHQHPEAGWAWALQQEAEEMSAPPELRTGTCNMVKATLSLQTGDMCATFCAGASASATHLCIANQVESQDKYYNKPYCHLVCQRSTLMALHHKVLQFWYPLVRNIN